MACYVLAHVEVIDWATYGGYATAVLEQLSATGGRVLAAGPASVVEGSPMAGHNVILEFSNEEAARRWYDSDAYQGIISIRHKASSSSQVAILPGWEGL